MANELAILQAQLDALLDDQSKLENSVLRVKTKNREEHENYRTIQHNQFMSARPRQPNSTPGPGDYNHAQAPPHMRRPTGGLIQPLPINSRSSSSSSSSATISSTTRGRSSHKRRGGGGEENNVGNGYRNVDEGSVIDYDAVSRAQHLIRARPVGMASFRRPSDPIVKAAAAATRSAANGGRATHGPTSVSLLTRACAVDRRSSSSSLSGGRVSRVVFRAAPIQPAVAAAAAASSGVTTATIVQLLKTSHGPCPLVLGDGSTTGTVSIGSRTVTRVQVCAFSLCLPPFIGRERILEVFEDAVC